MSDETWFATMMNGGCYWNEVCRIEFTPKAKLRQQIMQKYLCEIESPMGQVIKAYVDNSLNKSPIVRSTPPMTNDAYEIHAAYDESCAIDLDGVMA